MPNAKDRSHFIVKHGLDAFEKLPNFIWRTDIGKNHVPHRFNEVKEGDLWISFAYTSSDKRERSLSLVTGFYECVTKAWYGKVPKEFPLHLEDESEWSKLGYAWMIEGKPWREQEQPSQPVGVLPINDILSPKRVWNNQAIIPITVEDFGDIREHALSREFDTGRIPLIGREPECEQELLAVVVSGHEDLGIEKILRVRKAFPDMLVQIGGNEIHLELELYSSGFFSHGHDSQVEKCQYSKDGKPVAVLCWIHNCPAVESCVSRVYELQTLIRERKTLADAT